MRTVVAEFGAAAGRLVPSAQRPDFGSEPRYPSLESSSCRDWKSGHSRASQLGMLETTHPSVIGELLWRAGPDL